ncbi:MAG TPA: hypothetical protein VJ835_02415 [Fimbriimonadaceae bacterium]|nr:hypothetical protein [Fimbriimonadaceae bacterium]
MLLTILIGTAIAQAPGTLDIPKASWPAIFFGEATDTQSIVGRTALSGLPNLQKKGVASGVTEIRIWEGFGLTYLEGYRFRKDSAGIRGWWIQPAQPGRKDWKAKNYLVEFKPPKMGWPEFWKSLEDLKISTLPDFESLDGPKNSMLDGVSYVVEFAQPGRYRTYMYDNPFSQKGKMPELDNLRNIVRAIHAAFRSQTVR